MTPGQSLNPREHQTGADDPPQADRKRRWGRVESRFPDAALGSWKNGQQLGDAKEDQQTSDRHCPRGLPFTHLDGDTDEEEADKKRSRWENRRERRSPRSQDR
jgi:hypothetical protein